MKKAVKAYGEVREFEILDREVLEEKIEELDAADIYSQTFRKMLEYTFRQCNTYIDARNGNVNTYSSE